MPKSTAGRTGKPPVKAISKPRRPPPKDIPPERPNREPLSIEDLRKLETLVVGFIDKFKIGCPEAICQFDDVLVNADEFIENLCDVVGYYDGD